MEAWGWNQRQMAEYLRIPLSTLNGWLKGYRTPADDVKGDLVHRLGIHGAEVAPDWLRDAVVPQIPETPPVSDEVAS